MSAVLADTHAIVWYLENSPRLSPNARISMETAARTKAPIYISAITLVEMVYLLEKRRIAQSAWDLLTAKIAVSNPEVTVAPVTTEIAVNVSAIPYADVSDLPDRIIAATGLWMRLPVVTHDHRIRSSSVATIW